MGHQSTPLPPETNAMRSLPFANIRARLAAAFFWAGVSSLIAPGGLGVRSCNAQEMAVPLTHTARGGQPRLSSRGRGTARPSSDISLIRPAAMVR
jgi:hypothetical protein